MQHALVLMGRESKTSPFPEASVAKAQIVRGWRREEGECCTAESFCLDLSATPGSEWNKSATNVFVDDFIDVGTYQCTNRKLIRHAFVTHFRTIKRQYDRQCADAAAASRGAVVDRSAANREKSKEQRKYNVSTLCSFSSFVRIRLNCARRVTSVASICRCGILNSESSPHCCGR